MMLSAKKQFTDFINSNQLFSPNDTVLLTVSGGKDSVLMATLFAECGYHFAIAHCNFNLRGDESLRDENFVKALAEHFNVPFFLKSFDTETFASAKKISIQMAARQLRYDYFRELYSSQGFDKISRHRGRSWKSGRCGSRHESWRPRPDSDRMSGRLSSSRRRATRRNCCPPCTRDGRG